MNFTVHKHCKFVFMSQALVVADKSASSSASGFIIQNYMTCSLSLTVDDICCDLPVTEPVSFHGHITVSATEAFLPPDPECGMLYLKNSDRTQVLDSLGAN